MGIGNNIDPTELTGGAYLIVNDGLVEDLGTAFISLTGYTKSDFQQMALSEVIRELFGFDFDIEQGAASEAYLFKKSREPIEVIITAYQIGNKGHKLYLFQQKCNFILNSELSFSNKLLKENHIGVGLYNGPDFRLLKANEKYLGYMQDAYHMEENPVGHCLGEMISDYTENRTESMYWNIAMTGETIYKKERQTVSEKGEIRYWNQSINPICEDGKVKYIVIMLEDITEDTLQRKQIEEKNIELEKAIEMKDEMLMLISHELKTPLSIITSSIQAVELICNNELSDKVRKYLNKIRQNTYRQLKLVNNILDNTRINAGLFRMNRTYVDIVFLTKSIIDSISVFAERKSIKIKFSTDMEQSIISTDVDMYERILLNLLSNAVKFTPDGKSIEVILFQVPSAIKPQVCIQVKDNGIGIPNDQKDLIFERFRRVEKLVSRHSEGTGIGLYLVKMLVSQLEGKIDVESKEGIGSTFTLIFPTVSPGEASIDPLVMENHNEQLITASAIEFSDIYYGA